MKRRNFVLSSIASCLSSITIQAKAKQYLSPIYHLLLDEGTEPINGPWLDSVGLLPIGHPAFKVTDRSQKFFVNGDAVVQGNGTELSPYKDFYFLGGRNSEGQRFKSSIVIDPSDTVIYVKGMFRHSDHEQDTAGQYLRVHIEQDQMSNGAGGFHPFNAERPLIFAPWEGEAGPIFDAENGQYPASSGNSFNDSCPIFSSGNDTLFTDVEFRGFTVKNGICANRMVFFQGCRTAHLISCHVYDGKPQSQSPAMSGGIAFEMSKVNANHSIDHCEIHNNAADVTNNIGEISWLSSEKVTTTSENTLSISNSLIHSGHSAFTGKHSGHSSVIVRNSYIHSFWGPNSSLPGKGVYARGGVLRFEYNLFKDMDRLCTPDYQRLHAPQMLTFDHNTVDNCGRVFSSTTDKPTIDQGPTNITLTNNAFSDNDYNGEPFALIALYNDLITPTPDSFTSANNRFGFPQISSNINSIFYKRPSGYTDLNYADAMTLINDNSSLLAQPNININNYTPLTNGNCYQTGSKGTNIGAF